MFFLLRFLFLGEFLLHKCSLLYFFSGVSVCGKEGFGELGELIVYRDVLEATSVCCETFV
jgi:hypothetical protein